MQRWEAVPSPVSHVFWRQKRAFQLAEDTYADWVLFAVTEGRFRYGIGAARGEAGFGDLVFCPPQTTFHREVIDPVSFHFYTFRWSSLDGRVLNETSGPEPAPCGKISIRDHNRLSSTYFYLQQQLADGLPKERALALLRHLFTDLWLLGCLESEPFVRPARSDQADPDLAEAAQWIQRNAFGPVRMKELGAAKGWSAVQLTRRFAAAYGQTPMDYLTSLRLNKAKTLLLETDMTLDEIAGECGYENGFYLSRMFSKKLRISPSAYRRMHRV